MSAEHRLTPGSTGLYGKHPGFGDFISAGLPESIQAPLADWMQNTLGEWRDWVGEGWQRYFDASPLQAFWIGPALTGGVPLRGVCVPSHDKSGRRFPLLVAQLGGQTPVLDPAQDFYMSAANALVRLRETETFDPRAIAEQLKAELPPPDPEAVKNTWPTYWAVNPDLNPAQLFAKLKNADHQHAVTTRSYWWFYSGGERPSGILSCQGFPGPGELNWLLSGGNEALIQRSEGAVE